MNGKGGSRRLPRPVAAQQPHQHSRFGSGRVTPRLELLVEIEEHATFRVFAGSFEDEQRLRIWAGSPATRQRLREQFEDALDAIGRAA